MAVNRRLSRWLFSALLPLALATVLHSPAAGARCQSIATDYHAGAQLEPGDSYMGLRMLASLRLQKVSCRSLPVRGLSALAWSADTGILYALSDRAHVLHLRPVFDNDMLVNIDIVDAYPLRGRDDKPLAVTAGDSEGMALLNGDNGTEGDEQLLISFERQPRIDRYRTYGLLLGTVPIYDGLRHIQRYRTPNQALESVVVHPRLGMLTAPERPLANQPQQQFGIYNDAGQRIELPRADAEYGSLTDMALTADNDLLVLERIFSSVFGTVAAVIHRIDPDSEDHATTIVARLDRDDGHLIDNFEGLTRHRGNRYFLVSDDNGFPFQQTLLFYFELR